MKVMKGKSHDMELHHFPVFSSKAPGGAPKKTGTPLAAPRLLSAKAKPEQSQLLTFTLNY